MADNRPTIKLRDCADFQEGYVNPSQTSPEYFGNDVRWLRAVDLNDSFVHETSRRISFAGYKSAGKAAQLFAPGSLAISKSGTIGRLGILMNEMCGNRAVINIRPRATVCDTRYLFYVLFAARERIISVADGSVQKNLYISQLGNVDVVLLPLSEQKRIAHILGTLDDKIELNRRMNATLEAMARALFQSWFVDFDPVRAKAAGQTPAGIDPATAALFPSEFEDSALGEIPKGWTVKPIGEVVTVRGGGTPSTKDGSFWSNGTNYWATPKDLSSLEHPILLSTERRITDAGVEKISSGVLPIDTVLLSSRAPVGYLALAKVRTAINQGFIAIECEGPLKPHFVLHWLNANMDEIKGRASGTTFAEISKSAFRPIPAVVPSSAVVQAFEEVVKPMFDMITQRMNESRTLAVLRDALLPKLLSGELNVGKAVAEVT